MEFNEILEQVNKYGLPNVVSVLFMFMIYIGYKNNARQQNALLTNLLSNNKEVPIEQIKVLQEALFDLSKHQVLNELYRIFSENNLHEHEHVANKIRDVLTNIHHNRNTQLGEFERNKIKLSEFTNPEWIDKMTEICLAQIHISPEFEHKRVFNALSVAYDGFKIEFYNSIVNKTLK